MAKTTAKPNRKLPHQKTSNRNRVLVVIPTLGDRISLLKETLQSVAEQSPKMADIVVVCPQKSLEARKLAAEFGASIIDDPGGLSEAINVGIAAAKPWHSYVTEIGDDDLLTAGSLAATVAALDNNPQAVLAFGYCNYINTKGQILFTSRAGRLAPWLMRWGPNLVPLPGLVFRLSAIREVGDFASELKYSMDLDMLLRLRRSGTFINTGKVVAAFRWHPLSSTVSNRKASLDESQEVKRRYMTNTTRRLAPIWEPLVRKATQLAADRVNAKAKALERKQ
jgi:glycosyltransferase involved in cell wall biosynthesis